ncbi:putative disease resistance RPP13-like protein 1 [Bidens hawaiensis]|uniref:putative disease resistance RPP13-like protein 1 n=1 Tax=Bidens hawaiensis TaxID=980011 RepID=UPI00404A9CD3
MAETAVSAHLKVIFEKLADEALKKYVRAHGIHSDLKNLERILSQIQRLLNDASRKEIVDEAVKHWLNDLQHLAYRIDNIHDDVATKAMHRELTRESGGKVLTHKLHNKLDSITTELQNLYKAKSDLGLIVKDEKSKITSRRNETSLPDVSSVVGREGEKKKLLSQLLWDEPSKENFSIIPIVGMGGVGKTTLARLLYNDTQVNDHFELKAWVYVSDNFDIYKISDAIAQSVTKENKEFKDLNQLQMAITQQFEDKRFLLVVDDVWTENYDDWENLVRPFHSRAHGSRIIITTRKNQLLKKLGFDHLNYLNSLSNEDALSLLASHALGVDNFDSHITLKAHGEGIVKRCAGLPLAVGRLLRTKVDREDWVALLNSEIWDLGYADSIIPALSVSYHDLSSDLKRLFVYCSLFPKGFLFDKEELVLLWMAEGFIIQTSSTKSIERLGQEYFEDLLSRCFFQDVPNDKSLFVMHDLMNDLATFVAGDSFLRFDMHIETTEEDLTKYLHMSFIREEYVAYQKFEAFKSARSLRTFLAVSSGTNQSWNAFYLSSKILVDLLPELSMLRVLCLSRFEISEVPDFIGSLKHLRYLNLSRTKIKELPEIVGNLYNLQTLIVCGCQSLTKLPKSFLNLKNLLHFDIRDTPQLEKLPMGIGELKSLHTLTKIIIGRDNGFLITEFKGLKNLHGEISIQGLHNVQRPIHAREANLSIKRLTKLELNWGDGSQRGTFEKEVLNELKPHTDTLEELKIVSYGGIDFSNWVGDPSFLRLVHVSIRGCRNCTSLPPLGQLPSLKELSIQGMDRVEIIDSELFGPASVAFPSLEILRFEDMPGWDTWLTSNQVVFPCLRELYIKDCPKLIHVLVEALPSMRVLHIDGCGVGLLRHLIMAASSIIKLEILSILGLTYEAWRDVLDYLGAVEEVRIYKCNEIKYLWESKAHASKVLVNLQKLYVYSCLDLVSLAEKEEEEDNFGSNLLPSLRILDVWHCNNMKCCCCPNSIESLCIGSCGSVTHLSLPTTRGGQRLKSLDISLCNKQMEIFSNASKTLLEIVYIYHWPNLKSITQLSTFIHLTHLELYGCPSIESFPDLELSKLASLQFILIEKCPSMDYSFPRGLWPPKLVSLGIGGLKKPISEWNSQNFPASLVELTLFGEDVSNFSELSHLLPSSLTRLCIEEFDKLGSLSMGLEHLTSLQHLEIEKCPKMIHLPEWLLPSLLSLRIYECPNLEERCNGRGSHYWPLIYHIPCIEIQPSD